MSYQVRRGMALLCVAMCLSLAVPLSAHATAVIDKVGIEVGPDSSGTGYVSGDAVAYMSVRRDPQWVTWGGWLNVSDALTGALLFEKGAGDIPDVGGFDGEWIAYRDGVVGQYIGVVNVHTGESIELAKEVNFGDKTVPLIDAGRVIWGERFGYGNTWTYKMMDLSTDETQTVVEDWPYTFSQFKGDRLSYTKQGATTGKDLCFFDVSTKQASTFAYDVQGLPSYYWYDLNNDSAVWATISTNSSEIFRHDFASGATTSLLKVAGEISPPASDERLVAWSQGNGIDVDVFGLDTSTGQTMTIAGGSGNQSVGSVSRMHVSYEDYAVSGNNGDLYSATLGYTVPSLGKVSGPRQLRAGVQGRFLASFSNPDVGDHATIVWDFGDGSTQSRDVGASGRSRVSHAYSAAGTYEGSVTITDASGMKDVSRFKVVVR